MWGESNLSDRFLTRVRAISQVVLVTVLHISVIFFLELRLQNWEKADIQQVVIVYSVLVIILYVTCVKSLVTGKKRYNLFWFLISTIPSISLLFLLHKNKVNDAPEYGFVYLKFDSDFFGLVLVFPFIYFVIQLTLLVALWILKYPKE